MIGTQYRWVRKYHYSLRNSPADSSFHVHEKLTQGIFFDAATLTEVFPCFFLSFKANVRVNLAKTGHGPHSHKLLCSSMYKYCLFCVVLCIVCV